MTQRMLSETAMCDCHCRYGGHVVAKLPFEPFSLLGKLAHRGLESPEPDDCALVRACCLISSVPPSWGKSSQLKSGHRYKSADLGGLV